MNATTKTKLIDKYALPGNLTEEDYYLWERYDTLGHAYLPTFLKAIPHANGFYCGVILQHLIFDASRKHHEARIAGKKIKAEPLDVPPTMLAKITAAAARPTGPPYYMEIVAITKASKNAESRVAGAEMEACLRKNGMWES